MFSNLSKDYFKERESSTEVEADCKFEDLKEKSIKNRKRKKSSIDEDTMKKDTLVNDNSCTISQRIPDANIVVFAAQRSEFMRSGLSAESHIFSTNFDERSFCSSLSPFPFITPTVPPISHSFVHSFITPNKSGSVDQQNVSPKAPNLNLSNPIQTPQFSQHIQSRYDFLLSSMSNHLKSKLEFYESSCLEFEELWNVWQALEQISDQDVGKFILGEDYNLSKEDEKVKIDISEKNVDVMENKETPNENTTYIKPELIPLSPRVLIDSRNLVTPIYPAALEDDEEEIGVGWVEEIIIDDDLTASELQNLSSLDVQLSHHHYALQQTASNIYHPQEQPSILDTQTISKDHILKNSKLDEPSNSCNVQHSTHENTVDMLNAAVVASNDFVPKDQLIPLDTSSNVTKQEKLNLTSGSVDGEQKLSTKRVRGEDGSVS
ncbi:hypothetical protein HK096_006362 [Nowakowskiella sp. JEL0078]|nr:hypothetical protein HK096_006362 [Nowakowskiella sp. JEL0078]